MIIVFRSRSQTLSFARILKSYNVACNIINTPKRINVACSVCVAFAENNFPRVVDIVKRRNFDTLAGIYVLDTNDRIKKVY